MKKIQDMASATGKNLLAWSWTKALLYWMVLSAGTMSEFAFLLASLWMTLNASIHRFILLFTPESMTLHISDIAVAAYIGLPECILSLAIKTTLGHIRVWNRDHKKYWSLIWSILYGVPTLTFLGLSLWTIGCSVLKVDYTLPDWMVVIRALSGYSYGITALLYWCLGQPQEADRLAEKDLLIAELHTKYQQEKSDLAREKDILIAAIRQEKSEIERKLMAEITDVKTRLEVTINHNTALQNVVKQSNDFALEAIPESVKNWLNSGIKTAKSEEITLQTGISKRRIENAIKSGYLQVSPRNDKLILISSLTEWLPKNLQLESPILHVVND